MLQRFSINITLRVLLMLLLGGGIMSSLYFALYAPAALISVVLFLTVLNLIRYVSQTNRDLANFFSSVKYDDFITNISSARKGEAFEDLHEGFNLVNQKFRDIRAEKEANHQFLQTLVHHVEVGLLCINEKEEVILMNQALQKLLHKSYLINLDGIKKIDHQLWDIVKKLKSGERELIKLNIQNDLLQLSIQAVDIGMQKEVYRLITFQNIQNELEEQELISWQKLIRILTHEIMNSVAPISSLSSTMDQMLKEKEQIDGTLLHQVKSAWSVIRKRSEGLLDFTETYRTLTRIPPPKFQEVEAIALLEEACTLFSTAFKEHQIEVEKILPSKELFFRGDPHLLEQVLINLIKNAIDAVKQSEERKITIAAFPIANRKICFQVSDNGEGIPEDKMDQIFIPFFTTKKEGSGIGLSLSRQIMQMHKGTLELQSKIGEGTLVSLKL